MKHIKLLMLLMLITISGFAQKVDVTLLVDNGQQAPVTTAQYNLSKVLTEINNAHRENRLIKTVGLPMTEYAIDALTMLWEISHFYVDDTEVVERLWVFRNSMMVNDVPLIISVGKGEFGDGNYQGATVEFDKQGKISDFRFAIDKQTSESMTKCGDVVTEEQSNILLRYIENFRTAYNKKDIKALENIFSDDALIITGHVTKKLETSSEHPARVTSKVEYTKQNKQQYLNNLRNAFAKNKWIDVKFSPIGDNGEQGGCPGITRSTKDKTRYGVRLRQEWKSSNYSDEGYIFLLWELPADGSDPIIHVRTWQPEWMDKAKTHKIDEDEIMSLSDFDL